MRHPLRRAAARTLLLTTTGALALGCGSKSAPGESEPAPPPAAHVPEPSEAQAAALIPADEKASALSGALEAYLDLQEKLAGDDSTAARAAFAALGQRLAEAGDLPSTLREQLNSAAQRGAAAAEVAAQRRIFDALSEAVITALTQLGNPLPGALHVAHCPMAFDNRGARWVQRTDAIQNPYFGSEMLTCGAVDAAVASGHKLAPPK